MKPAEPLNHATSALASDTKSGWLMAVLSRFQLRPPGSTVRTACSMHILFQTLELHMPGTSSCFPHALHNVTTASRSTKLLCAAMAEPVCYLCG